jgi:hypothetical protein
MEATKIDAQVKCPVCEAWGNFQVVAAQLWEARIRMRDAYTDEYREDSSPAFSYFYSYTNEFFDRVDADQCPICGGRGEIRRWIEVSDLLKQSKEEVPKDE